MTFRITDKSKRCILVKSNGINTYITLFFFFLSAKQPVSLLEGKPINESFWQGGQGHKGCSIPFRGVVASYMLC
jgi:hypothetical protein